MPPLAGPRTIECWTRNPVNTRSVPSSIWTGSETIVARRGRLITSLMPAGRLSLAAASSNWRSALASGLRSFWMFEPSAGMGPPGQVPRGRGRTRPRAGGARAAAERSRAGSRLLIPTGTGAQYRTARGGATIPAGRRIRRPRSAPGALDEAPGDGNRHRVGHAPALRLEAADGGPHRE